MRAIARLRLIAVFAQLRRSLDYPVTIGWFLFAWRTLKGMDL